MTTTWHRAVRTGVPPALGCLLLLGVLPVLASGRPAGTGSLTFACWLSVWQLLCCLPLQAREWWSGIPRPVDGARRAAPRLERRDVVSPAGPGRTRRRMRVVMLITGCLFALATWAYVVAATRVGAVGTAIALQTYPLFAAGFEAVALGRRKSPPELALTGLILAGLYYLATGGTWRAGGLSPWFAVALAVPVLWTVAHVTLREVIVATSATPSQVTTSRLVVAVSCLFPLAGCIDGWDRLAREAVDPHLQGHAMLMGLAYYLELLLWFHAVRRLDVSVASTITVPAPVVTTLLAVAVRGESVHGYQLGAMAVVVGGLTALLRLTVSPAPGSGGDRQPIRRPRQPGGPSGCRPSAAGPAQEMH